LVVWEGRRLVSTNLTTVLRTVVVRATCQLGLGWWCYDFMGGRLGWLGWLVGWNRPLFVYGLFSAGLAFLPLFSFLALLLLLVHSSPPSLFTFSSSSPIVVVTTAIIIIIVVGSALSFGLVVHIRYWFLLLISRILYFFHFPTGSHELYSSSSLTTLFSDLTFHRLFSSPTPSNAQPLNKKFDGDRLRKSSLFSPGNLLACDRSLKLPFFPPCHLVST